MSAAPVDAIARHAAARPDAPAVVMADGGDTLDWRTLEQASRRVARALVDSGLGEGEGIAILAENRPEFLVWMWAARRAGLCYTTLSSHWKADEAAHVLADCGAKALFATRATLDVAAAAAARAPALRVRLIAHEADDTHDTDDACRGRAASATRFVPVSTWIAGVPADAALPARLEGTDFLYSSGTTGHPKGIRRPLAQLAARDLQRSDLDWKRFDAEAALRAIERRRVTHAQFVPTMFVRLLRLPPEVRDLHDRSSLRRAIHAAAPCPVDVKRAMIDWWGSIVTEYYSGTEAIGRTSISSREWLERPGSVGRPELGRLHVVGEDGRELGPGETGLVCFSGVPPFEYHGDPQRTRAAYDAQGRANIGDVGHVDADGYLYLTDRASHMIISGGVNGYPQETDNLLTGHPAVGDVAVIGVPDAEFGEAVKAVVVPREGVTPSDDLGAELIAWCRGRLSPIKCPRTVDFVAELPRTEAGKLMKRMLRDRYAAR